MNDIKFGSTSFSLNSSEGNHILKVFLWTVASAGVAMLLSFFKIVEVPVQWAFIIPIVNTLLVALQQWVSNNSQKEY